MREGHAQHSHGRHTQRKRKCVARACEAHALRAPADPFHEADRRSQEPSRRERLEAVKRLSADPPSAAVGSPSMFFFLALWPTWPTFLRRGPGRKATRTCGGYPSYASTVGISGLHVTRPSRQVLVLPPQKNWKQNPKTCAPANSFIMQSGGC